MKIMDINKFEVYRQKLDKILDDLEDFCSSIESEIINSLLKGQKHPRLKP